MVIIKGKTYNIGFGDSTNTTAFCIGRDKDKILFRDISGEFALTKEFMKKLKIERICPC